MKKTQIGYLLVAIIVVLIVIGYNYKKPAQVTPDNNAPQTENNIVTQDENAQVREIAMDSFTEIIDGKYFPQYSIKEITVKKGETIRLKINTTGNHDFKIDELNVYSETPAGKITTVEFTADKVGEFIYYCTKPNHRTNGHWGTIKVVDPENSALNTNNENSNSLAEDNANSNNLDTTTKQDEAVKVREIAMDSFTEIIDGKYFPQYSIKEITVKKGETIRLKINTTGNHDFKIDELNVYSETPAGEITTIEFTADKVGEFIYWCTKPNHRTNGHWGTIKITE